MIWTMVCKGLSSLSGYMYIYIRGVAAGEAGAVGPEALWDRSQKTVENGHGQMGKRKTAVAASQ